MISWNILLRTNDIILTMGNTKSSGEIFTPKFLVKNMLDFAGYTHGILWKHVLDNSCGDGAFLAEIVLRYIENFRQESDNFAQLKNELEIYIHGIEINKTNFKKCILRLSEIAKNAGIHEKVNWGIRDANALEVADFDGKMDFVVGNPPYVRIHNLAKSAKRVREFNLSDSGMTDLYITFYELGFRELAKNGKLCLITPSSWLTSKSGAKLREAVMKNRELQKVIDLGHFQPFDNATTYTFIASFQKDSRNDNVDFYKYNSLKLAPEFYEKLPYDEIYFDGKLYFNSRKNLAQLRKIRENSPNTLGQNIKVKNGFATLADKVFIGDFDFGENSTIPILKASTGKFAKIIFPYDRNSRPLREADLAKRFPKTYAYLLSQKNDLLKRNIANAENWFLFGRTQALNDVYRRKIAINTTIKDVNSIKLREIPAGIGIYSGLYILTDLSFAKIREIIKSQCFIDYVASLKKYKSGGYYTFSSDDLKKYLLYNIRESENNLAKGIDGQRSVLGSFSEIVPSLS